jgi:hypothetical protein
MADDLTALGEVVTDRTLVLNVLRGLNERFTHVGALLWRARPFPTFLQLKDDLSLEELTLGSRPPSLAAALAATTKPPPQSSAGNGTSSKPNRRGKRDGEGGGGSGGGGGNSGPTPQHHTAQQQLQQQAGGAKTVSLPPGGWPTVYNPWTGITAVVRCPPSSSGAHTSTATAAAGVRRPTTASAPVVAATIPASCYSSWRL